MRAIQLVCVGAIGVVFIAAAHIRAQSAAPPTFAALLSAYSAGDRDIVARSLRTSRDLQAILPEYGRVSARWRSETPWNRTHVAFAYEIAAAALRIRWNQPSALLERAGQLVVHRPTRIGDVPDDDAFEVLAHRTAIAMAQRERLPIVQELYSALFEERISPEPAKGGLRRIVDPRFVLYAGIAAEQVLAMRRSRAEIDTAVELYREARRYPVNTAEASVRLASVLFHNGWPSEAVSALEDFEKADGDDDVRYLGYLFRGRALAKLDRPSEAIAAFEHALSVWPSAQAPASALSAIYLIAGRLDLSVHWASVVRTKSIGAPDPWWTYGEGEGRTLQARLTELRMAIK